MHHTLGHAPPSVPQTFADDDPAPAPAYDPRPLSCLGCGTSPPVTSHLECTTADRPFPQTLVHKVWTQAPLLPRHRTLTPTRRCADWIYDTFMHKLVTI